MAATITITDSTGYIIFKDSAGTDQTVHVPKHNLTILQRTDAGNDTEYIYLNWPAGDRSGAKDWYKLNYLRVTSPTLASNDALVALLQEYVASAISGGSAGGAGGGSIVYTNAAGDFTATPGDGDKTVTIAGLPYALKAIHVVGGSIKRINSDDEVSDVKLTDVTVAAGVITLDDEADNFALTDTLYVTLIGPDKWYDQAQDSAKQLVQNPEWAHYEDPNHIVDVSNATVDQHYSPEIFMAGYRYIAIQLTGTSSTAGVTFKIYGTLNTAAATPADLDAAPSADWTDHSTDILGAATITLDNGASEIYYVDSPTMPYKLVIQFEPDHGTNEDVINQLIIRS